MQTCPRCGAENQDTRAACWNCFGQLRPPATTAPRRIVLKEQEPAEPAAVEPTAAAEAGTPNDVQAAGAPIPELAETEGEAERAPIDLDGPTEAVPVAERDEPMVERQPIAGLEETPSDPGAGAEVVAPEGEEPAPLVETPPIAGTAAPSYPESPAPRREVPSETLRERPARPKALLIGVPLVVLVLAALAAWWFLLANPSPAPAAEDYVTAMAAAMSGDVTKLEAVCTADSKGEIDSLSRMMGMMPKAPGFAFEMSAEKVEGISVNGPRAEVNLSVSTAFGDTGTKMTQPVRVALVREGPIFRRHWKVDLPATNRLAQEDAQRMMQKMFPKGVPGQTPSGPGVPGAPQMRPAPR